jgi:membrane protease YdiL (CAAX protease family)
LGYSRAGAVALVFSKQAPDLLCGIGRCLWSLGALPHVLVWDRQAGLHARDGRPTEAFAAFCGQLRVDWPLCAPADPHASGVVGRLQGYAETNFESGRLCVNQIDFQLLVLVLFNARVTSGPGGTDATTALHALGIVALARVVAIAAPLPDASATIHLLVVALSTGFAVWRLAPPIDPPIRDLLAWRPRTSEVRVLGACLGLGVVLYGLGAPALVGPDTTVGDVALALLAVALAATVEEVLFRGVLQSTLERLLGRAGVLVASVLFASLYLSAGSLALFLAMALAGLLFAASVVRARVLGTAVAGHILLAGGAAVVWPALIGAPHALLPGWATAPVLAAAVAVAAWLIVTMRPSAAAV